MTLHTRRTDGAPSPPGLRRAPRGADVQWVRRRGDLPLLTNDPQQQRDLALEYQADWRRQGARWGVYGRQVWLGRLAEARRRRAEATVRTRSATAAGTQSFRDLACALRALAASGILLGETLAAIDPRDLEVEMPLPGRLWAWITDKYYRWRDAPYCTSGGVRDASTGARPLSSCPPTVRGLWPGAGARSKDFQPPWLDGAPSSIIADVSGAPDDQEIFFERHIARIALAGRVPVKVDASYGAVRPGDLLVSSPTPGHAMRGRDPAAGTVLGKALEAFDSGTGKVLMLFS